MEAERQELIDLIEWHLQSGGNEKECRKLLKEAKRVKNQKQLDDLRWKAERMIG